MKKLLFVLLFAVSLLSSPRLHAEVSLSFFYDSLEDDGDWFEADDYGYCWQPRGVSADWSPYNDGYWTYTDEGWTWVSYESFGWATYHYGRWTNLSGRGWVWIPGYEWGPAWVSWRSNDDYVGWAPLPPQAVCRPDLEIDSRVDYDYDIGPSFYSFTSYRQFGSPSIRQVIVDRSENVVIVNQTVNITNISYRGDVIYNGGLDFDRVNRRCERPIERLRIERITRFDDDNDRRDHRFNRRENGRLTVVAPNVVPVEDRIRPRNIKANLGRVQAERGWSSVRDANIAERTRQKIRAEHKNDARPARANRNQTAVQALRQEARRPVVRADQIANREKNSRLPRPRSAAPGSERPLPAAGSPVARRPQVLPKAPSADGQTPAEIKRQQQMRRQREAARANQEQNAGAEAQQQERARRIQRQQAAGQEPARRVAPETGARQPDPEAQAAQARARAQRQRAAQLQNQAAQGQPDPEAQAAQARARAKRQRAAQLQNQAAQDRPDPEAQAAQARARAQRQRAAQQQARALDRPQAPQVMPRRGVQPNPGPAPARRDGRQNNEKPAPQKGKARGKNNNPNNPEDVR